MNKTLKAVVGVGSLLVFFSFALWRMNVAANAKQPLYGIVADISSSHNVDRAHACLTVAGLSEKLMQESAGNPGARMEVLALGDSSRGGEPLLLTAQELIPVRTTLSTGKAAILRQQQSYVNGIYNNCVKAPSPEYSAISLGIERVLEYTRSKQCGSNTLCTVYVDTDGNENVATALTARLKGKLSSSFGQPPILDNTGVDVRFCGMAVRTVDPTTREGSAGRRQAFRSHQDPARMEAVWRSAFTHPEQVSFEPFCAQPKSPNDYLRQRADVSRP